MHESNIKHLYLGESMRKRNLITLIFILLVLSACAAKVETVDLNSYMLEDVTLYDNLIDSDALFAIRIEEENNIKKQVIYLWDNQLRRDLRLALIEIGLYLDFERNKVDSYRLAPIEASGSLEFFVNDKTKGQVGNSDLTNLIIKALLPISFNMKSSDFALELLQMVNRLETLEIYGDTEVICLETITKLDLIFDDYAKDEVHYINEIDEVIN